MKKVFNYISVCFLFVCVCAFNSATYADVPKYKLIDLGLQESDQSEAVAVNDQGVVAGSYWMFGKKYYFLWQEGSGISLIDLPDSANIKVLNNAGQIAGNYKDDSGKDRGFIWEPNLGFNDIGTLGGEFSRVYDMNDLGQIIGESENSNISLVDGKKEQHAFLWQNDLMVDLGALSGDLGFLGDRSVATSINNHGQIIGTSNYLMAHKRTFLRGHNRSVAWQDGVIEEVDPTMEPQYSATSYTINNNGIASYAGKGGLFYIDISSKNKISIAIPIGSTKIYEITDNGDIFDFPQHAYDPLTKKIADCVWIKNYNDSYAAENEYVYVGFNYSFVEKLDKIWRPYGLEGAYDYNNKNWVVGRAENIYGEHHAVLLMPIDNDEKVEESVKPSEEIDERRSENIESDISEEISSLVYSKETIELILNDTLDGALAFYTADIEQKVRLLFLEQYSQDPSIAKMVQDPYREVLMLEAMEGIIGEIENLSKGLGCDKQIWFWDMVQSVFNSKTTAGRQKMEAFIKIKKSTLIYFPK